jgi:Putative MetA-pathway of phenol degradation
MQRCPCSVRVAAGFLMLCAHGRLASAEPAQTIAAGRQSVDDAWWTGPLLASPGAAMPRGHLVIETYLFDAIVQAHYDNSGRRSGVPRTDGFASQTYFFYGLTDTITLGLGARFGYQQPGQGPGSSRVGVGDTTVRAQLQVVQWRAEHWIPTISLMLAETFPTGRFDQLGDRLSDGHGTGAHTATVAFYSQRPFWLPTGRILRARLNLSWSFSDRVAIEDASVYDTASGFRGQATPGETFEVDLGAEYSLSRQWVLAMDVDDLHGASTTVLGFYPPVQGGPVLTVADHSGTSQSLSVAPAIEYNWNASVGLIAGVIVPVSGRNTGAGYTPTIALNMVF